MDLVLFGVDLLAKLLPATLLTALIVFAFGDAFWSSDVGVAVFTDAWRALHLLGVVT